jgi:integration host factor subunit beta
VASEIVNLIFDGFIDTFKKGDKIEIRGFGDFTAREYRGHIKKESEDGKNDSGEIRKLPFFKVGRELRQRVNRV